ncbi:MAG: CTP synthase [Patescibacteria group bacterium]
MSTRRTHYIFVTGGVCSGLGKGIAAASIGALLKASKFSVFSIKFDPYLNVDPGTMNPYQHGEVFVLKDGTETDLDLGHYERFLDVELTKSSSVSTGQLYQRVIQQERAGRYLGKTIQIIPHITDAIKQSIQEVTDTHKPDVLIMEIGGTVGDIEGEPYLEAARQMRHAMGNRVLFVHVALLPYLKTTKELKTKPAQASVRELQRAGIHPDIIIARADETIRKDHLEKLSLFCGVPLAAVIPAKTSRSIYDVPLDMEKYGITKTVLSTLGLEPRRPALGPWRELVRKSRNGKPTLSIVLVGKYTEHGDAYLSVVEALRSASYANSVKLVFSWVDAEKLEAKDVKAWSVLKQADGIVVPGGFGARGVEGKIAAVRYAREQRIPYFGLCLGMQIATIEFARNVAGLKDATSTEFTPNASTRVIHIMPDQEKKLLAQDYGATMRLGNWPCKLVAGSLSAKAYGETVVLERHRHRYEFNNDYREQLEKAGLRISGSTEDGRLVEIVEVVDHPWFVGVQFHPEFTSRPLRPQPLFREFITAAKKCKTSGGAGRTESK